MRKQNFPYFKLVSSIYHCWYHGDQTYNRISCNTTQSLYRQLFLQIHGSFYAFIVFICISIVSLCESIGVYFCVFDEWLSFLTVWLMLFFECVSVSSLAEDTWISCILTQWGPWHRFFYGKKFIFSDCSAASNHSMLAIIVLYAPSIFSISSFSSFSSCSVLVV